MEAKPYPEDKRRDLIKRSIEDVVNFLTEITDREGKQFVREKLLQSQVPGFRKGRAPLKRTVPMLINELQKEKELTNSDSVVWSKFQSAWIAWVISHLELNQILRESFVNDVDFDENNKCIVPPNSELDIQCFKILLESSRKNQIDQGTIRRFYEYGYFLPSDEIEVLIEKAPTKSEIERQQRLAALPDQVEKLSEAIDSLKSRLSAIESNDEATQNLDHKIAETIEIFESQLAKSKSSFNSRVGKLKQSVNSRLSNLEGSVNSLESQVSDPELVNKIAVEISQLDQGTKESFQSFQTRLDGMERTTAEIKTAREAQHQTTNAPRIAYQAVQIGAHYAARLEEEIEHYQDENDYLEDFKFGLRRFGVTGSDEKDSGETAAAIHVCLKAFPALEVSDTRIINVWRLMCDNHLHLTKIDVEMGWLGLQDWFPKLFSQECFAEQLRTMDLDISIRKMLEIGNMPWAIRFSDCDRSFPESYLPRFLDWIGEFFDGSIRVFLTRCSGTNRCETNQDVYVRAARLPKPQGPEPIEAQNLKPSGFIVTRSEWESWCRPILGANQLQFLNQLQEAIESTGIQIPLQLLRDIQRYVQLSNDILASSRALDWALTLRFLPWIGRRGDLIEIVQNLMNQENRELPHFRDGLLHATEEGE